MNVQKYIESARARHLPPDFEDLDLNDPELDRLWDEYSEEISILLENESSMKNLSPPEIIGWAKEYRKAKKEKRRKSKSFGARERRVEPHTKKASPFKPKEQNHSARCCIHDLFHELFLSRRISSSLFKQKQW